MTHDHDHPHHTHDWKHGGVRVIPGNQLDANTAQTPGMNRAAAINFARVGAEQLWAGTVTIHSDEALECVLVRSGGEAVVVNLDIAPVEKPENVPWVDSIHKAP